MLRFYNASFLSSRKSKNDIQDLTIKEFIIFIPIIVLIIILGIFPNIIFGFGFSVVDLILK